MKRLLTSASATPVRPPPKHIRSLTNAVTKMIGEYRSWGREIETFSPHRMLAACGNTRLTRGHMWPHVATCDPLAATCGQPAPYALRLHGRVAWAMAYAVLFHEQSGIGKVVFLPLSNSLAVWSSISHGSNTGKVNGLNTGSQIARVRPTSRVSAHNSPRAMKIAQKRP